MNALINTALQAFGLKELSPTKLDLKLLTDGLGRTLPMGAGQFTGGMGINWLGGGDHVSGYSNHGTAFSVVSYILDAAAPIPWAVYRLDTADNRAKPDPKHPLAALLYRPNPKQTWAELKRQAQGCYEVKGEYFLRRVVPAAGSLRGKTAELWCLVGQVELLPLTGMGEFDTPTAYRHTDALTGRVTEYPAAEILHVKTWNPSNPHRGLSPIQAGSDAVTAAKSGLESRVRQYQNQGPAGLLFAKPDQFVDNQVTPEQASRMQSWFGSYFRGGRREGQIPIVTKDMGFLSMGLSPVDLDVLAAIPHDKDAVADLWHFPGQLLNGSKGTTFSNMSEAGAALYSRCVIPLETVFRDGLNRWIGAEYEDGAYIDFDTSHIPELQPNKEKLVAWLATAYFVTTQDKQRMLGVPVDDKLPKYIMPAGYASAEQLFALVTEGADAAAGAGEAVN